MRVIHLPSKSHLLLRFEPERSRLLSIALRILGSSSEAEDVLQDAWIRLQNSDQDDVDNMSAWLTTVVSRLAIDRLRLRTNRREDAVNPEVLISKADESGSIDPEEEFMLAESVGIALLVVLNRLRPQERVAFVLHDLFDVSFHDIAAVLDCSPEAARQRASRARKSVRGVNEGVTADDVCKKALVNAFFNAARSGDFSSLLRVLDVNITLSIDPILATTDRPSIVRGAKNVAGRARLGATQQLAAHVMLVDGEPAIVVAPAGHLKMVMTFLCDEHCITAIEIVANPRRLGKFNLSIIN